MWKRFVCLTAILALLSSGAFAQSTETEDAETDAASDVYLENLVAPFALYPDTLLLLIFVSSTNPM